MIILWYQIVLNSLVIFYFIVL